MRYAIVSLLLGSFLTACGGGSTEVSCEEVADHYVKIAPAKLQKLLRDKTPVIESCRKDSTPEERACIVAAKDFETANACHAKHRKKRSPEEKAAQAKASAREPGGSDAPESFEPYKPRKKRLTTRRGDPVEVSQIRYNYINRPNLVNVSLTGVGGARVRVGKGTAPKLDEDKRDREGGYVVFDKYSQFGYVTFDTKDSKPGVYRFELIVYTDDAEATVPVEIAVGDQLTVVKNKDKRWVLQCLGKKFACSGGFNYGKLTVTAPKGTVVALGEQSATVGAEGKAEIAYAIERHLSQPIATLNTITLPLSLTFPNGKLTTTLSAEVLQTERWPLWWLQKTGKKGRTLPGEPAYNGKPRVMWAESHGYFGTPKVVHEVDLIAKYTTRTKKRSCGRFRARSGGKSVRYHVKAETEAWKIFDRRTGKRIASKTFRARYPKCPRTIRRGESADINYVSKKTSRAWLRSQLAKARGD